MTAKKKSSAGKKFVSFSDDDGVSRSNRFSNSHANADGPPVYVRRTWFIIPFHLPLLTYWFLKYSDNYDIKTLAWCLIPCQLAYLVMQFNQCTVYGNKIVKINILLLFISAVTALLLTIPCTIICILFGAPFLEKLDRTWWLSLHCCILAYPAIYSVCNSDFKVGYFKKYFILIAVGCWISCAAIPLDWDRPWQSWPIPLIVGGYLGAFVGYTFGTLI
ncbi:HBR318Wp [Eremothecium sinecaudum]|uniref:Glycosylphosphatidylinositol anchor biosynthesis protein 11 n=1 Tax=Eremothecium sinecaudum TaxID=45286 RepID=A0A120K1B4_9SACH|nr:HBR318Wp [Eremothecium sinecaudum]AMD19219.1 HBR318Wp [Eremothecium sinecaudum]